MTADEFTTAVMSYCRQLDASVTSWYRTPHYNHQLGREMESAHTYGLAVDVIYDNPVSFDVAVNLAEFFGLTLQRWRTHDHLQPLEWRVPAVRR